MRSEVVVMVAVEAGGGGQLLPPADTPVGTTSWQRVRQRRERAQQGLHMCVAWGGRASDAMQRATAAGL